MATLDIPTFRKTFTEFQDASRFPDTQLTFFGTIATAQIDDSRWDTMAINGVMLYVAHEITLWDRDKRAADAGGTPGQSSGPINSKTVGSVTASYDTQQAAEKDAGWWNLTTYGKQFIRLARLFGAGCVQL